MKVMLERPDGRKFKKMFLFRAHCPALNVKMAFTVSVCNGLNFFIAGQEQGILKTAMHPLMEKTTLGGGIQQKGDIFYH